MPLNRPRSNPCHHFINFVDFGSPMFHAKFKDQVTSGFEKEYCIFRPSMSVILVMLPRPFLGIVSLLFKEASH